MYSARLAQRRWLEAAIVADERMRISADKYGPTHRYTTHWMYWAAAAHRLAGDEVAAMDRIQPALEILEPMAAKRLSQQPPAGDRIFVYRDVGVALTLAGRHADAEPHLRRAVGLARRTTDLRQLANNGSMQGALGECLFRLGQASEAEKLLVDGVTSIRWADYLHWKFYYTFVLIELYDTTGRPQAAEYWRDCIDRRSSIDWIATGGAVESELPGQAASTAAPSSDADAEP